MLEWNLSYAGHNQILRRQWVSDQILSSLLHNSCLLRDGLTRWVGPKDALQLLSQLVETVIICHRNDCDSCSIQAKQISWPCPLYSWRSRKHELWLWTNWLILKCGKCDRRPTQSKQFSCKKEMSPLEFQEKIIWSKLWGTMYQKQSCQSWIRPTADCDLAVAERVPGDFFTLCQTLLFGKPWDCGTSYQKP